MGLRASDCFGSDRGRALLAGLNEDLMALPHGAGRAAAKALMVGDGGGGVCGGRRDRVVADLGGNPKTSRNAGFLECLTIWSNLNASLLVKMIA